MKTFRDWLYVFFLFFFAGYTVLAVWLVASLGIDVWQAFGLGGVFGVFVKMISDGWQFYYRKRPDDEKK